VQRVLPFVITAGVAVVLTLVIEALLPEPLPTTAVPAVQPAPSTPPPTETVEQVTAPPPVPPTATLPAAPPTAAATPTPTAAATVADDERTGGEPSATELTELQNEMNRLWGAFYLSRAANQLADAETALRVNDLTEVEQVLETARISLDRAYDRSPEQDKGPISEFRVELSRIHADLRIRPENLDQELQRLRQSMLSLVDERG
jgi:hypothetical protein